MSYRFFSIVRATLSSDVLAPEATMGLDECFSTSETLVYSILAASDGLITAAASVQLLRLYVCNRQAGWSRQKVFHCLILASNFGYTLYFVANPLALCGAWPCWSHGCGFILVAIPQTVFLATFLLLLSFWVDLCHQATDEEDEEDDDIDDDNMYSPLPSSPVGGFNIEKHPRRWCVCFRRLRVRGRQRIVIVVCNFFFSPSQDFGTLSLEDLLNDALTKLTVAMHDNTFPVLLGTYCMAFVLIVSITCPIGESSGRWSLSLIGTAKQCLAIACVKKAVLFICGLTVAFAVLIWYGMGNNPIDSGTMAEAYSYFYAVIILLSGGGLAAYGLVLYTKMCRLRSGKASDDITKVAGLAVVSVVCFSLRASLIFFSDISVINIWHSREDKRELAAILTLLYFFIGESIPSVVVLWVMREMPRRSIIRNVNHGANHAIGRTRSEIEAEQAILQQAALEQWIIPAGVAQNHMSLSRSYKSNASTPCTPPEVDRYSHG